MTDSQKLDLILEKVTGLETRVASLEEDMQEVKQKVTKIDLNIENEVRVNIRRVAEAHLDLSRKLNECVKISSDILAKQELQDIYFNMYNSKLKAI